MTTYLTDSWSTLSGLASVAYGSPDRYPEVSNQVKSGSVLSFLGSILPSDLILNFLREDEFILAMQLEYGEGEDFSRFVDSQGKSISDLGSEFFSRVISSFNEFSTYESSLVDAIEYALGSFGVNSQRVKDRLLSRIADLGLYSRMAMNLPTNKLDKLPSGTKINLDDRVKFDTDSDSVSLDTGYLTPLDYFSDVAYPGMGSTGDNLPGTLIKSITEGYRNYATLQPLDDVFRPGIASLISLDDIRDISRYSRSISGLGTINTVKDLSGIANLSFADQVMYEVDISDIVVNINGYTVYDPLTDSNGDFIDPSLVPDYESYNSDSSSGLTYSYRTRSSTFES